MTAAETPQNRQKKQQLKQQQKKQQNSTSKTSTKCWSGLFFVVLASISIDVVCGNVGSASLPAVVSTFGTIACSIEDAETLPMPDPMHVFVSTPKSGRFEYGVLSKAKAYDISMSEFDLKSWGSIALPLKVSFQSAFCSTGSRKRSVTALQRRDSLKQRKNA